MKYRIERIEGFYAVTVRGRVKFRGDLQECHDWMSEQVEADRFEATFDPENIYNLPSIRQSIEEDRR